MHLYFGFGANSHPEMIRAITGRGALSIPAKLRGFSLCVESFKDICKEAQVILSNHWDAQFVSYGIARDPNGSLEGRVWLLTRKQRDLIKQWELTGTWSYEVKTRVEVSMFGCTFSIPVESEELRHQRVQMVSGVSYEPFIAPKEKILSVARMVRCGA